MLIVDLAKLFIPPQDTNPAVTAWRYLMWGSILVVIAAMLWLWNSTASADDLKMVQRDITTIRKAQIENQVFQKSIEVCTTAAGPLRNAYQQELSKLVDEWRQVVKNYNATPSQLKTCAELGIAR